MGYRDSIETARGVLSRSVEQTEGVLSDPGPWIHVVELAPSEVKFAVYFWVHPQQANVLAVGDRVLARVKTALDEAGIDIPYPHRVVFFHDLTVAASREEPHDPARPGATSHAAKRNGPAEPGREDIAIAKGDE